MNPRPLLVPGAVVAALAVLVVLNARRIERIEYVSALAARPEIARSDATSTTGWPGGRRRLITPERSEAGWAAVAETQQMLARAEWRLRHREDENAPAGRSVVSSSPHRWWLASVAALIQWGGTEPAGAAVERATLTAAPILQALLVVGGAGFCAWRFGGTAAAVFAFAAISFYPLAAGFLPGVADPRGLALLTACGGLFALLAAFRPSAAASRWFATAGVFGGLGLWLDPATQVPLLLGTALGGIFARCVGTRDVAGLSAAAATGAGWRQWSLAGAATTLAAYLIELAPAHLGGWELRANHPLYALAWLGLGELHATATALSTGVARRGQRAWLGLGLAMLAIGTVPLAMHVTGNLGFLADDLERARLTHLPGSVIAGSFGDWIRRDGVSLELLATLLPLGFVVLLAARVLCARGISMRAAVAFSVGPVLVAIGFALPWLGAWALVDVALLVALIAGCAAVRNLAGRWERAGWIAAFGVTAGLGLVTLWPAQVGPALPLTRAEAELLMERDLVHWLSARAAEPAPIVYAPPHVTAAMIHFGGFRGLGTRTVGNEAGFGLTLAIAGARTLEEVQWAFQSRGVRYVVIPSWDPFFEEFARLHLVAEHADRTSFFVRELRRWQLPLWLRPVAYSPPAIKGWEDASVLVFAVEEEPSPAVASGRLAEFLVETSRLNEIGEVEDRLRQFPGELSALTARAQIHAAREESSALAQTIGLIRARLASRADRFLVWDRRVSLAIVLAQAGELEAARPQVQRCIAEADAPRLRSLSDSALYRLLVLSDALALPLPDSERALAEGLLPPALREEL